MTAPFLVIALASFALHAVNPGPPPTETRDTVAARVGVLRNGALFTPSGGGRTGQAGDHAVDFGLGTGPVYVQDATFMNAHAATDALSFSFWMKRYDIANSSAFWVRSPASADSQRGFQAHVPWSDSTIYYDTGGAAVDTRRSSLNIDQFPGYTGDVTWWTANWHHFVFTKQADVKRIFIDGILFLETSGADPLFSDFADLYIGSDAAGGNLLHGLIDDFAVFGTALTEAQAGQIFSGTSPSALPASAELLAFWNFNDSPAAGQFVSVLPAPNSVGAIPDYIQVVHVNGTEAWTAANVSLRVDGVAVTPTLTTAGNRVTLSYAVNPLFKAQSTHSVSLTYPAGGGQQGTAEWSFTVGPYTRDSVASRIGTFGAAATFSSATGGRSGQAGDYAADFGNAAGFIRVRDGAFLNAASATDQMTVVLWVKKYSNAASSAFWANSPSSNNGQRGIQAHIPWSDNTIYYDSTGCCTPDVQRISLNIDQFPNYTGDITWWTGEWHHFVFTKDGGTKNIYIDGILFHTGGGDPLPTDFTDLYIGSNGAGASRFPGLIDDFSIFGTALTEAQITQLFNGTAATALPASAELLAHWNFNDFPPEGLFVSTSPANGVTDANPNLVQVVHRNGTPQWDLAQVSLLVDNAPVTASITRQDATVTARYTPAPLFAPNSSHTATLRYPDPTGAQATYQWSFTVGSYTVDSLSNHVGTLKGAARFTADAGGRTGQAGDYGMDFGTANAGQGVHIYDASFLNIAAANDEMSIASWQKLHLIADSALFWGISPSSSGSSRGFSVHTPWSNNVLYFDTAGCCDGGTQRINAGIDTFPDYTGEVSWWQDWHHLVFQKKGSTKEIWIDGQMFLTGENTNPLPTDFTEAWLGNDPPDNARLRGILDDFAVFRTALTEAQIMSLFSGTKPDALPAAAGLLAYWDFNDPPVAPVMLGITRNGAAVSISYSGTLQSATSVIGPFQDVAGAANPHIETATGTKYFRSRQ